MGVMTRVALWLVFAAGVALAACGFLPWYHFQISELSGLQAHTVSGFGDGYFLIATGTLCATLAAWMNLNGKLSALAIVAIVATSGLALGVGLTALLAPGNVCGPDFWTGSSGHLACVGGSGDEFFSAGDGYVTGFVWLAIGLGLFTLLTTLALPFIEDYFYEDAPEEDAHRRSYSVGRTIGITTQTVLRIIMWSSLAMAVLAFLPWFDTHLLGIAGGDSRVMTGLGDAVLFASVALAGSFLAYQMQRDPSELIWFVLVVAGAAAFVIAGTELTTAATSVCRNDGSILGFVSAGFGMGCDGQGGYLTLGTATGWLQLSLGALAAILALSLPIIETLSRDRPNGEGHDEWA